MKEKIEKNIAAKKGKKIVEKKTIRNFYQELFYSYTLNSFLYKDLNKALYSGKGGFKG